MNELDDRHSARNSRVHVLTLVSEDTSGSILCAHQLNSFCIENQAPSDDNLCKGHWLGGVCYE